MTRPLFFALTYAALCSASLRADDLPQADDKPTDITKFTPTPDPQKLPDDLRNPGPFDDEYPIPQDAAKAAKNRAEGLAWWRKQTVGALGNPNDEKAKVALEAVAIYNASTFKSNSLVLDPAVEGTRQALIAETTDPLARYYAFRWHGVNGEANKGTVDEIRAFVDPLLAGKYPHSLKARLAWWAALRFENANLSENAKALSAKYYERFWTHYVELAKSKDRFDQDLVVELGREVEAQYVTLGQKRTDGHAAVLQAFEMAKVDSWVKLTAEGNFKYFHALDAKKAGGPDAAKLTKERLAAARKAYAAAWEANEEMPEAATMMIRVCSEEKATREEMEAWYAKAMTADPDAYSACVAKLNFLSPTRDGSAKAMLAFGRQCLRTKNDRAALGYILFEAHRDLARGKERDYYAEPETWADLREVYETRLKLHPADRYARTSYGSICLSAGEGAGAVQHLSTVRKNPWPGLVSNVEASLREAKELARQQGEKP